MHIPKSVHKTFSDAIESGHSDLVQSLIRQSTEFVNHHFLEGNPLVGAIIG